MEPIQEKAAIKEAIKKAIKKAIQEKAIYDLINTSKELYKGTRDNGRIHLYTYLCKIKPTCEHGFIRKHADGTIESFSTWDWSCPNCDYIRMKYY